MKEQIEYTKVEKKTLKWGNAHLTLNSSTLNELGTRYQSGKGVGGKQVGIIGHIDEVVR